MHDPDHSIGFVGAALGIPVAAPSACSDEDKKDRHALSPTQTQRPASGRTAAPAPATDFPIPRPPFSREGGCVCVEGGGGGGVLAGWPGPLCGTCSRCACSSWGTLLRTAVSALTPWVTDMTKYVTETKYDTVTVMSSHLVCYTN